MTNDAQQPTSASLNPPGLNLRNRSPAVTQAFVNNTRAAPPAAPTSHLETPPTTQRPEREPRNPDIRHSTNSAQTQRDAETAARQLQQQQQQHLPQQRQQQQHHAPQQPQQLPLHEEQQIPHARQLPAETATTAQLLARLQAQDAELEQLRTVGLGIRGQLPGGDAFAAASKAKLPEVVPGHKAQLDGILIPNKVAEAIRAGNYIPYTRLTINARLAASSDHEHLTISANGTLVTSSSLNRGDERQMSFLDWSLAADVMTDKVKEYLGEARSLDFTVHHQNVKTLTGRFGWQVAREYDIQQREALARDATHNLKPIEDQAVSVIIHQQLQAKAAAIATSTPPAKRKLSDAPHAQTHPSPKKARSARCCFRCGRDEAHTPHSCKEQSTTAGIPTAPLAPNSKNPNTMLHPDSRQFCISWTFSQRCSFATNCRNAHACPICLGSDHGAARCPKRAAASA